MKKIGILSDTHSCWDDRFALYFAECDEIWHAGDFGDITIANRLEEIAHLRGVSGNIDHGEVRRRFNELEIFNIEGINVLMTHIGGYPGRWSPGLKRLIKENNVQLVVDGHSHILKVVFDPELNCLLVNPGAAGHHGWQKKRTLVTLCLEDRRMFDAKIIELGIITHTK